MKFSSWMFVISILLPGCMAPIDEDAEDVSEAASAVVQGNQLSMNALALNALALNGIALNGIATPRLRSLDRFGVPRFAEGGFVAAPAGAQSATFDGDLRLAVEHSEGTFVRFLESPAGLRTVAKVVEQNPRKFRRLLGG